MTNEKETINSKTNLISLLDLQSVLTIFYISIVVIGMLFNNFKYSAYQINIFEHSSILDFLVAPLGDSGIFLFTVGTLVFTYIIFKIDSTIKVKFPNFYNKMYFGTVDKSWFKNAYYFQWFLFLGIYLLTAALFNATYEKKKMLKSQDRIEINFTDGSKLTGKKIGANTSFHFLLKNSTDVAIIPTSSIKHISSLSK